MGLLLFTNEAPSGKLIQLSMIMTAFVVSLGSFGVWMFYRISQLRLGVIGGSLILEQKSGRRTIARDEAIRYSNTHLMADDVVIFMGNPHQRMFDRKELNDYVFPRLKHARKCSQWEMQKHLWRAWDPQLLASIIISVLAVGLLLALRYALPQ